MVDSDEEDMSHMDAKGRLTGRESYTTEEQWQQAKAKQETLPKAAFQFGQKMADGRKPSGKLGKGKEDKLKNELNSIKVPSPPPPSAVHGGGGGVDAEPWVIGSAY